MIYFVVIMIWLVLFLALCVSAVSGAVERRNK